MLYFLRCLQLLQSWFGISKFGLSLFILLKVSIVELAGVLFSQNLCSALHDFFRYFRICMLISVSLFKFASRFCVNFSRPLIILTCVFPPIVCHFEFYSFIPFLHVHTLTGVTGVFSFDSKQLRNMMISDKKIPQDVPIALRFTIIGPYITRSISYHSELSSYKEFLWCVFTHRRLYSRQP